MPDRTNHPYGGAADARMSGLSLADRFRRHAEALIRHGRSGLSAALMQGAANDLDAGGLVARLFEDVPVPLGAVPQLRLLAALHHLVLSGAAPELAAFYPSAGGERPPEAVWLVAIRVIEHNFGWIKPCLARTVQTNEPGRSAVLYPALLWLTARHGRPIRLLEIGASAGLNLLPDHYAYVVSGAVLGRASSPVRFQEPWRPGPPIGAAAVAQRLRISARAGCDRHPLDPRDPDDRVSLLSYIWPDEMDRIQRLKAALDIAAAARPGVSQGAAAEWLPQALADRHADELTVVWHSLVRQYVEPDEWGMIEEILRCADRDRPVVRLGMEPGKDHLAGVRLTLAEPEGETLLADCGDHGPPVRWQTPDPLTSEGTGAASV